MFISGVDVQSVLVVWKTASNQGNSTLTEQFYEAKAKIPRTRFNTQKKDMIEAEAQVEMMQGLEKQVVAILKAINDDKKRWKSSFRAGSTKDPTICPVLLNSEQYLPNSPMPYSIGSVEHLQSVLSYNCDPWLQAPSAIETFRELVNRKKLW